MGESLSVTKVSLTVVSACGEARFGPRTLPSSPLSLSISISGDDFMEWICVKAVIPLRDKVSSRS